MGSPVDDALDWLEGCITRVRDGTIIVGRTSEEEADEALATVRSALEQLREERDAYRIEGDHCHDNYEDAEDVIRQIAEARVNQPFDPWARGLCQEFLDRPSRSRTTIATVSERVEAAEAEVQRYREGLRELLGPNPNYDPDGQHDYGWENEPPKPFAPRWVRDKVDALLADRPDEPWESFAASQGGIFNGPHPADVEPDGGEAK